MYYIRIPLCIKYGLVVKCAVNTNHKTVFNKLLMNLFVTWRYFFISVLRIALSGCIELEWAQHMTYWVFFWISVKFDTQLCCHGACKMHMFRMMLLIDSKQIVRLCYTFASCCRCVIDFT